MVLVAFINFDCCVMGRFTTIQQIEAGSKVGDKYTLQVLKSKHIAKVKGLFKTVKLQFTFYLRKKEPVHRIHVM